MIKAESVKELENVQVQVLWTAKGPSGNQWGYGKAVVYLREQGGNRCS